MPYKLRKNYCHKFTKSRFKVLNYSDYDKGLVNLGDITLWFTDNAIKHWYQNASHKKSK